MQLARATLGAFACLLLPYLAKAQSPPTCTVIGTIGTPFSANLGALCLNPPNPSANCSIGGPGGGHLPAAPGINSFGGCTLSGTPTQAGCFEAGFGIGGTGYAVYFLIGAGDGWPLPMEVDWEPRGAALNSPTGMAMYAEAYWPGSTLQEAAAACNFIAFDWQQTVWYEACPSGMFPENASIVPQQNKCNDGSLTATAVSPRFDPVNGGDYPGYVPPSVTYTPCTDCYPFFYALTREVIPATNNPGTFCAPPPPMGTGICLVTPDNKLTFYDHPTGLWDDTPAASDPPVNNFKGYTTTLVGVSSSSIPGSVSCGPSSTDFCTPIFWWSWNTTWNGTSGGITPLDDDSTDQYLPDPGTGTGGITVTNINGVPLPAALSPSQLVPTLSDLNYNSATQLFEGTLTMTNAGASVIQGPLELLLMGLPSNVTLTNATGNLSGTPYLTVSGVAALGPGQSATVGLLFSNPANVPITFTSVLYTGAILQVFSPCDLQFTGSPTLADVQLLVNEALGLAVPVNNLNGDGVVNVTDVKIEINVVLTGACTAQ
ncbi:MAG TPA: hypothetical protein VMB03_19945 [Bryobacteraceae bacterium]|nr:hypothetical protein [Bryobacteraceae bacterium]